MIIEPTDRKYRSIIQESVVCTGNSQICISMSLHASICKYDQTVILNNLIQTIAGEHRRINRRSYVESFLVALSDNDSISICSILIKYNNQLLDKTVQDRIVMIRELVKDIDAGANIFMPYVGYEEDLQRYHLRNIQGPYSINIIKNDQVLQLSDCIEY